MCKNVSGFILITLYMCRYVIIDKSEFVKLCMMVYILIVRRGRPITLTGERSGTVNIQDFKSAAIVGRPIRLQESQ